MQNFWPEHAMSAIADNLPGRRLHCIEFDITNNGLEAENPPEAHLSEGGYETNLLAAHFVKRSAGRTNCC